MDLKTKSVYIGSDKDKSYNSVIPPIYPSSTFRFESLGKTKGYDYTRSGNPTRSALEENLASLEGGAGALATATGMAAVSAVLFLLKPGDHVITGHDIYGGTYRLFHDFLSRWGIHFSFVDMTDLAKVKGALRPETKMIWIETPSNPLLHIVDLGGVIGFAAASRLITAVDNTFLSPCFQRPFDFGADLVVHSTTKYLNGHSDVVGGAVIYRDPDLGARLKFLVNTLGVGESPFDAWLVLRGIKTLAYRMKAHEENAVAIANFLKGHPAVRRVYYPGLSSHPQADLIRRQMKGFGGMLAFELDTEKIPLEKFFARMKLFQLAESLGGAESLIEHPWTMSHASMGEEGLQASGITQETVRVSVGLEAFEDLRLELAGALAAS